MSTRIKPPKGWATQPDLGRRHRAFFWYKRHNGAMWTDRVFLEVTRVHGDLFANCDALGFFKAVNQMPQGVWFDPFKGDPDS